MEQVELTAEQLETLARWAEGGEDMLPLTVQTVPPPYLASWTSGDVFAIQGDSYIHVGRNGAIKDRLPAPAASSV
jgi:hypothetical protein